MFLLLGGILLYLTAHLSSAFLEPDHTYFFLVTDPHGFFSGHSHEPHLNADYASLASFMDATRLQAKALPNCFVYFFENGDLVDGGGLTSTLSGKLLTFPLLDQIGFDARTLGNHELYLAESIRALQLPGNFVTSNIVHRDAKKAAAVGHRYLLLPGNILVLGFLYEMTNYDPTLVQVERVSTVLASAWFRQALEIPKLRSIVVLAHMDCSHPLIKLIFQAIRSRLVDVPIVFATGHTHERKHKVLDSLAISVESGKFMDTMGVVSFQSNANAAVEDGLRFAFVDPNRDLLFEWSRAEDDNLRGKQLRRAFSSVRNQLGLDRTVGFLSHTLKLNTNVASDDSLIAFWIQHVVSQTLLDVQHTRCGGTAFFAGATGSIRFDLFAGNVSVDDLWQTSPFAEPFLVIRCVRGLDLLRLVFGIKDSRLKPLFSHLPLYVHTSTKDIKPSGKYDFVFGSFDRPVVETFFKAQGVEFQIESYREDEGLDGHSVWVKHFESKQQARLQKVKRLTAQIVRHLK